MKKWNVQVKDWYLEGDTMLTFKNVEADTDYEAILKVIPAAFEDTEPKWVKLTRQVTSWDIDLEYTDCGEVQVDNLGYAIVTEVKGE